jgi:hypothetical protein
VALEVRLALACRRRYGARARPFIAGLAAPDSPFLPSRKIARYESGKFLFSNTFKAMFLPSGCNFV